MRHTEGFSRMTGGSHFPITGSESNVERHAQGHLGGLLKILDRRPPAATTTTGLSSRCSCCLPPCGAIEQEATTGLNHHHHEELPVPPSEEGQGEEKGVRQGARPCGSRTGRGSEEGIVQNGR